APPTAGPRIPFRRLRIRARTTPRTRRQRGQVPVPAHGDARWPSPLWRRRRRGSVPLADCRALLYFWQVGHQNTLRPSSSAVRIVVPHTRHGSPALRYTYVRGRPGPYHGRPSSPSAPTPTILPP